ncbi:MAG TPA: glycosyltransferase family 2 protein, partial [Polyangiaceae bacterium]
TTRSAGYILERFTPESTAARLLGGALRGISVPLRAGHQVGLFARRDEASAPREKLSIVLPVFNEARYVADVIEALLRKELSIDKEIIVVESNSQDGTREIVQRFEGRPTVRVIYEDRPRGKGHALKTGLAAVTGSIVLIQDADFEYAIDDYDALLEPILQRRAQFVLGSRSLGLNDWKVRRFAQGAFKGFLMNVAQVAFAKTYNALYQQRATDVNTMFKVFRRECLDGIALESDGFDLDIELACMLAKNGHAPLEVPVNYVSRGFEDGKKIQFLRDALPSYLAFFRYRFR